MTLSFLLPLAVFLWSFLAGNKHGFSPLCHSYNIRQSVILNLMLYGPSEPNVQLFDVAEIPVFQGSNHWAYGLNQ